MDGITIFAGLVLFIIVFAFYGIIRFGSKTTEGIKRDNERIVGREVPTENS
mgnify:CR=1 FL=1